MRTELQNNSLWHLRRTLEYLSSTDYQRLYKAQVPFVHVPEELLAQWSTHIRYLRENSWFRVLFDIAQVSAMERFDQLIKEAVSQLGKRIPDVPAIFQHAVWGELGSEAKRLFETLPSSESDEVMH